MILNGLKFDSCLLVLKMRYYFLFTRIIFRSVTIACYSENFAFIFKSGAIYFTCVFKFCFHACYFFNP